MRGANRTQTRTAIPSPAGPVSTVRRCSVALTFKPDPLPNLDRKAFTDTWKGLQLLKQPAVEMLRKIDDVAGAFLATATDGEQPVDWCEICGAPFFEDDDYVTGGDDGVSTCRYDSDGNRVGRCFRDLMEA